MQIRFLATQLAAFHLREDLRPALEYSASIKGGSARRNARQLLELLNWQMWSKDPELLAMKKREAIQQEQENFHKKLIQELHKGVVDKRKLLKEEGWVSLLITQVAGAAYVDWETLYAGLEIGELLGLKREPDNPHDGNAILVLDKEKNKLGYIPRHLNEDLAKQLDAGKDILALLLKVDFQARIYLLYIEVFGKTQGPSI